MANFDLYRDISERAGGCLYLGVVGPVRTGKSTLIQRILETLMLPGIENEDERRRTLDTMPQSAMGRTVMTTEPKFVPTEAVDVKLSAGAHVKMKLVDCVGYLVEGAAGAEEDGAPRMVKTPWQEEPMTFADAATYGTKTVMDTHANVGIVVTTDGSISNIPREGYADAEERVIREMKGQGKPFLILLNSAHPESAEAKELCETLQRTYEHPVVLIDALHIDHHEACALLELLLKEFPARTLSVTLPAWVCALKSENTLKQTLIDSLRNTAAKITCLRQAQEHFTIDCEGVRDLTPLEFDYARGEALFRLEMTDAAFFSMLSETCGIEIRGNDELFSTLCELSETAKKYKKIEDALLQVEEKGYGIVTPDICDLHLEEPEIVEKSGAYGVKLRASAPSIHMIRANIETEVSPTVGSERQSQDMVRFLLNEFREDPKQIWESNLFGKTLHELVSEGLHTKLDHMPDDARSNLATALEKIVNEGANGLVCLLL